MYACRYWDIVWDEGGENRTKKGAKGKGRFDRFGSWTLKFFQKRKIFRKEKKKYFIRTFYII